jgi:hypothetical protein
MVVQEGWWGLGTEGTCDKRKEAGRKVPLIAQVSNSLKKPLEMCNPGDSA